MQVMLLSEELNKTRLERDKLQRLINRFEVLKTSFCEEHNTAVVAIQELITTLQQCLQARDNQSVQNEDDDEAAET